MLVRYYRSYARIGIKALQILDRSNRWNEAFIKTALKQTYDEMEGETLENFKDRAFRYWQHWSRIRIQTGRLLSFLHPVIYCSGERASQRFPER